MANEITFTLDTGPLMAAIHQYPEVCLRHCLAAAKVSADHIASEAEARLSRQVGPQTTGATVAGIRVEVDRHGDGYAVTSSRDPMPDLPKWLERGTKENTKPYPHHHHATYAKPFFDISGRLEEGAHRERIIEALQAATDEVGLGQ